MKVGDGFVHEVIVPRPFNSRGDEVGDEGERTSALGVGSVGGGGDADTTQDCREVCA